MFDYIKLLSKYNKVCNERDALEQQLRDEIYKLWIAKLGEPLELERLRKENKQLRKKNKVLKEIIKGE